MKHKEILFRIDKRNHVGGNVHTEKAYVLEGCANYLGNAVVNYTDVETPYTRIIEHKPFEYGQQPDTVITKEYPVYFQKGMEPYYPVNDKKNISLYDKYKRLATEQTKVLFGRYRYYNMD